MKVANVSSAYDLRNGRRKPKMSRVHGVVPSSASFRPDVEPQMETKDFTGSAAIPAAVRGPCHVFTQPQPGP
ncbi:MAG: hypothetical protein DMG15_07310, partial [Acidobacteria bacterium]